MRAEPMIFAGVQQALQRAVAQRRKRAEFILFRKMDVGQELTAKKKVYTRASQAEDRCKRDDDAHWPSPLRVESNRNPEKLQLKFARIYTFNRRHSPFYPSAYCVWRAAGKS